MILHDPWQQVPTRNLCVDYQLTTDGVAASMKLLPANFETSQVECAAPVVDPVYDSRRQTARTRIQHLLTKAFRCRGNHEFIHDFGLIRYSFWIWLLRPCLFLLWAFFSVAFSLLPSVFYSTLFNFSLTKIRIPFSQLKYPISLCLLYHYSRRFLILPLVLTIAVYWFFFYTVDIVSLSSAVWNYHDPSSSTYALESSYLWMGCSSFAFCFLFYRIS